MSAFPTVQDLQDVLGQAMRDPLDFLTRGTVLAALLVLAVGFLGVFRRRSVFVRRLAPSLAAILVYLAVGSLALGIANITRFHDVAAHATEVQLMSGATHLVLVVLSLAVLAPHLRRRDRVEWLRANLIAVAYWAFLIVAFTPQWFDFQGQRELLRSLSLIALAAIGAATALVWARSARRLSPQRD